MSYAYNIATSKRIQFSLLLGIFVSLPISHLFGQDFVSSQQNSVFKLEYAGSSMWSGQKDVVISGEYAFLASTNGLQVLDISDPSQPTLIYQEFLNASPFSIFIADTLLFIGPVDSGTLILDISQPSSPTYVGHIPVGGRVSVNDDVAYIVHYAGMHLFDISDPKNPALLSEISLAIQKRFNSPDLFVQPDFVYVVGWNLFIVDISDPSNPQVVSEFDTPHLAVDVEVQGRYAYIADLSNSQPSRVSALTVVDVSSPSNPSLVTSYKVQGDMLTINLVGEHAYVGAGANGTAVFDISDPTNLTVIGCSPPAGDATRMAVDSNIAISINVDPGVLAGNATSIDLCSQRDSVLDSKLWPKTEADTGALIVLDVSDIESQTLAGQYAHDFSSAWITTVTGSYAFVSDEIGHITIIDVSSVDRFPVIGNVAVSGLVEQLGFHNSHLYVVSNIGLFVFDCTNIENPVELPFVPAMDYVTDIIFRDDVAYLADGSAGVRFLNVSDPALINDIARVNTPDWAAKLSRNGNYLYVADRFSGVQLIDITNPRAPFLIPEFSQQIPIPWSIYIASQGSTLVSAGGTFIDLVNIADPLSPIGFSQTTSSGIRDIGFFNTFLVLSRGNEGLEVFDVSNYTYPSIIASFNSPGFANRISTYGRDLFVSDVSSLLRLRPSIQTDVSQEDDEHGLLPNDFQLNSFPNPFNLSVTISWSSNRSVSASIDIYNIVGQKVRKLVNGDFSPGSHSTTWDGLNEDGNEASSGLYFVVLKTANTHASRKMTLLK